MSRNPTTIGQTLYVSNSLDVKYKMLSGVILM